MRKLVALVVCGMLVAPLAFAQTNVLSQNAVGYVKVSIDAGTLALVSQAFVDIDGNPQTMSTVVGDQLPNASRAFIWDSGAQQFGQESFVPAAKGADPTWTPDTNVLEPGVGFFLECATGGDPSYDVYLLGEVPSAATTDLTTVPGLTMQGFPYPATEAWTNTATAQAAVNGDRLFLWDQGGQQYDQISFVPAAKGADPTWSDESIQLAPGEGYFYDSGAAGPVVSTEAKPYPWP